MLRNQRERGLLLHHKPSYPGFYVLPQRFNGGFHSARAVKDRTFFFSQQMHQMVPGGVSLSTWSSCNPFRLCRLYSLITNEFSRRRKTLIVTRETTERTQVERAEMLSHIELGYLVAVSFSHYSLIAFLALLTKLSCSF